MDEAKEVDLNGRSSMDEAKEVDLNGRSSMDEAKEVNANGSVGLGHCEREGPMMSEVDLISNHSDLIQVPANQNQNQTQGQLNKGHGVQDSLNNNAVQKKKEEQDCARKRKEEDDRDDVEEEDDSSSLTCGQSAGTPMTDSSVSDTGSLVELCSSVSPETTDPISPETGSPDDPFYNDPESKTQTCTTGISPGLSATSTTGSAFSTPGSASSTQGFAFSIPGSAFSPQGSAYSNPGPSASFTTGSASTTPGSASTTPGSASSTMGPTFAHTGPASSAMGPAFSSTGSASSTTGPTTEPVPSPALLATLQKLGERGDHTHLPEHLHLIAEAFVLQEDYERAVCCIQLERLYHQRLVHNLSTLQEQWEKRCRSGSRGERKSDTDLAAHRLTRLAHVCRTHQRPSERAEQRDDVDFALKSSVCVEERLHPCSLDRLVDSVSRQEEGPKKTDHTQSFQPIKSAGGALMDSLCSNDCTTMGVSQDCRDSTGFRGFHREPLIDGSLAKGDERLGRAVFTVSQSEGTSETELEHTSQAGGDESDPLPAGEMGRPKPEEQPGGEEEVVEEAEEALILVGEDEAKEEEQKREIGVSLEAPLEISVIAVEQLTAKERDHQVKEVQLLVEEPRGREEPREREEVWGSDKAEGVFGVEIMDTIREGVSTMDDMAKRITVVEMTPVPGLLSILKRRSVCVEDAYSTPSSNTPHQKQAAKRRVRFKVPEDGFDQEEVGLDSCLLLFLLCLVTVVISLGGTALYCALGNAQSSVCTDFSRSADFYLAQLHHGMEQLRHWLTPGS
ncbi:hypothetical protein DPEC_G00314750 [Dallia pectoralis]|uniref:Uncharacterized protein n=1 Tax=Dallia pectoralis TaxID=75939 RepID=A0ACC2FC89_DALPE|nr:hypothetical protein DPEC_G00314750 [Dallia pectoralis]